MGRPKHWPARDVVDAKNAAAGGMREPFPHDYLVVNIFKQPDGTYREEFRTYAITRRRTLEEEQAGANPFEMTHLEIGRTFRVGLENETGDEVVIKADDFSAVQLVEVK
jgi:hypothetical protein